MLQPAYRPKATLSLIAVIVAVFVAEIFYGNIVDMFAFTPAYAFQEPWTFVTSVFLHGSIEHIFFNMLAFVIFGTMLESRIGSAKFTVLFFLAGIMGNFGYMITASDPNMPAIGASGAVYGVIGAAAILMPTEIIYFWGVPIPMIVAAFLWGASEFAGLFVPSDIARGSHLMGLFFGAAYGLYFRMAMAKARRTVDDL